MRLLELMGTQRQLIPDLCSAILVYSEISLKTAKLSNNQIENFMEGVVREEVTFPREGLGKEY